MSIAVEIAIEDEAGLIVAAHAGADRVELCTDLARGGLTPPPELVERCAARAAALIAAGDAVPQFGLHVLLRDEGDADFLQDPAQFHLTPEQSERLAAQAEAVVAAGADGVVLGALSADGRRLDAAAMEQIRDAALRAATAARRGLTLTCHRALDALPDAAAREEAMRELIRLGFHRALSSGGAPRALDGAEDLAAMVRAGEDMVAVCAGGGVRPAHLAELVRRTGVADVHLSARSASGVVTEVPAPDGSGAPARTLTDPAVATAAVDAAGAL